MAFEKYKIISSFKINNHAYLLIFLLILIPSFSSQTILNNDSYISLIIVGKGSIPTVSSASHIKPLKIYLTGTDIEISFTPQNNCPININIDPEENNITLIFNETADDISRLFQDLNNIKKVDFTHFKNKITKIEYIFLNCNSLEEVIMGNLDTSSVTSMAGMFQNTKITSLDLSGIKTNKVTDMNNMFNACTNLKYLNLRHFHFSNLSNKEQMLIYCQYSLIYLDIFSIKDGDIFSDEFFDWVFSANRKLIFCINKGKSPNRLYNLINKGFILNCSYLTPEEAYVNEEQTTYMKDIHIINTKIEESSKIITETNKISTFHCSSEEIFTKRCEDINTTLSAEDKDIIINNIMNDITDGKLDTFIDAIVEGKKEDLLLSQDDITFQITTTENQNNNEYNNISTIHLGNCETILKNIYHIPFNTSLIILKVDYIMDEYKFPIIGYEVFDPINKTKLDLSHCNNETIDYNIPIDINEEDLDKYNTSSDYYNDECSVFTTDDGTDIIILDRKKEFNENNLSLCESGCNYTNYNTSSKKSVCMCEVKSKIYSISEVINNKESISQNFNVNDSTTSSSNLGLMKCIDTLFSKYGLLKNLENYILIIMSFFYAGSSLIYYRIGSGLLESDITEILDDKLKNEKMNLRQSKRTKSNKSNNSLKKFKEVSNPQKKKKIKISVNSKEKSKKFNKRNSITQKDINIHTNHNKSLSASKIKINNNIYIPEENNNPLENMNNYELNTLPYKEALLYDKRDLINIYFSILKRNNPLLFSFFPSNDYNTMIIKLDIFVLKFGICSAINALFFTEATIHKIYADKGSYKLGFYLPKIILSFIFTHIIIIVIKYIFLSERNIFKVKKEEKYEEANEEAEKAKRCLIIKYILFYIIGTGFLVLFWFYLSSFCAVYQNTQIFLIINTFISLGISFIYPCIIDFIPSILRKISLNGTNNECLYITSKIIQII